jgi:hypothetical protein
MNYIIIMLLKLDDLRKSNKKIKKNVIEEQKKKIEYEKAIITYNENILL